MLAVVSSLFARGGGGTPISAWIGIPLMVVMATIALVQFTRRHRS